MPFPPKKSFWRDPAKSAKPVKKFRKFTPPADQIPCDLVFADGTRIPYESRNQALTALGKYVRDLPADPFGEKKAWIENK